MRYDEAVKVGAERLKNAGIEEANLDARLLLEKACVTDAAALYSHPEREVTDEEYSDFLKMLERREERIPLQHITEVASFMGLDFKVNCNVLIPRADTEALVEEALKVRMDGDRILDMCTGSGCILISVLNYSNNCEGVGADVSSKALEIARANAEALFKDKEDDTKISFVESDLFENVEGKFDLILSNPPYIATDVIPTLMPEVAKHEPIIALDGKNDGLWFYERIVEKLEEYLKPGGSVIFEIGYDQGEAVSGLLKNIGFTGIEIVKDYAGMDRVVKGTMPILK